MTQMAGSAMLDDLHGLRPARKHCASVLKRRAQSWPACCGEQCHPHLEAEAASDFASVMAPVRAGAEIVIDRLGLRSRRGRNHQEPQTAGSASVGVILDST